MSDEQITRAVYCHTGGGAQALTVHHWVDGNCCAATGWNLHRALIRIIANEQVTGCVHRYKEGLP
jgi:hypothetical protein